MLQFPSPLKLVVLEFEKDLIQLHTADRCTEKPQRIVLEEKRLVGRNHSDLFFRAWFIFHIHNPGRGVICLSKAQSSKSKDIVSEYHSGSDN